MLDLYTSGKYLEKFPTWHAELSPWSAKQIFRMIERNHLAPETICEVGCGAGEVLRQLQIRMSNKNEFWGYEISPQAFELCQSRANERLHFKLVDFTQEQDVLFDLILLIDVIEHVEDYFSFLRSIKPKSPLKMLHIPLDLSAKFIIQDKLKTLHEVNGHIHYFTRDSALRMLKDVDYEVLDYFYTARFGHLMTPLKKLLFAMRPDLTACVLGGYSLMVLAK